MTVVVETMIGADVKTARRAASGLPGVGSGLYPGRVFGDELDAFRRVAYRACTRKKCWTSPRAECIVATPQ